MLSWAVLNKIQLFFFILASFLVKKNHEVEIRKTAQFFFPSNHEVSVFSFFLFNFPSKPTRRQRPKAVGGASERSERGRSALFKNALFFSGKFLGCYIEAAQNFIRYVPFS